MGSVASWEHWEVGFISSLAQWVKDWALPQLCLRSRLWFGSDPWPWSSICCGATKHETKTQKPTLDVFPAAKGFLFIKGDEERGSKATSIHPTRQAPKFNSFGARPLSAPARSRHLKLRPPHLMLTRKSQHSAG